MTDIDRIARHCASLLIENENFKIRIEKLEEALKKIALDEPDCCMIADRMRETAEMALGLKND